MKPVWTTRRHLFAWIILSGFSSVYLWSLFNFPDAITTFGDPRHVVAEQYPVPSAAKRVSPRSATGNRKESASHREISALRSEMATLRQLLEDLIRQEKAFERRLATVEDAFGPNTSALPPSAGKPRITGRLEEKKKLASPIPKVTVTYSSLPTDGFGDILITGSPLPVAGAKPPTRTRFGVELATAISPDALKKEWMALSGRHEELLGKLEILRQTAKQGSSRGPQEMKLIAGPFPNAAGAALLCARLQAEGAFCKETIFSGDAL